MIGASRDGGVNNDVGIKEDVHGAEKQIAKEGMG